MQNIIGEKNTVYILTKFEGGIQLKERKEKKVIKREKVYIEKLQQIINMYTNFQFEKDDFLIIFFIWELKIFKELLKTYPENERIVLKGESNRKLQKYSSRENKRLGGYFCIEKEKGSSSFLKKMNFLLEYSQYIEIEFVRFYNHHFSDIINAYRLVEISKEKKTIIKYLELTGEYKKIYLIELLQLLYLKGFYDLFKLYIYLKI